MGRHYIKWLSRTIKISFKCELKPYEDMSDRLTLAAKVRFKIALIYLILSAFYDIVQQNEIFQLNLDVRNR